jgi:hypothetical protein
MSKSNKGHKIFDPRATVKLDRPASDYAPKVENNDTGSKKGSGLLLFGIIVAVIVVLILVFI